MQPRLVRPRSLAAAVTLTLLAALLVPTGPAAAAPEQSAEVLLSGPRTVTIKPRAGAPSDAGLLMGTAPSVTGSASVDTQATPPRATATVSAQGRRGVYQARFGALFTTTAPAGTSVAGELAISIRDLAWSGELRWDGTIVDYSTGSGGVPDGCRGCLAGSGSAAIVASVVNADTGETLATETVATPRRGFIGPTAVTTRVAGRETVTFPSVVVPSGTNVAVYVSLTTTASSALRAGATTGAATVDFGSAGDAGGTGGPTKPTTPPKPGSGSAPKGVSYADVTVKVVDTEPLTEQSQCSGTEVTPVGAASTALVGYFRAIDAGNYAQAFEFLDDGLKAGWASAGPSTDGAVNFASFMAAHVECVVVTGITVRVVPGDPEVSASTGIQWYEVALDARYITPFPGGSGEFQPFYKVRADPKTGPGRPPDQILDIATSLPVLPSSTAPPSTTTSSSTTTTSRPTGSTTTSTSTTTTTTQPPRQLSGPTTVVSLGDSFISGEAGRWQGNAFNPLLSRAGTDRAFYWDEITVFDDVWTEVESWGILGWFTTLVHTVVERVDQVAAYDTSLVYGDTDREGNHCHRSDVAEVNAPIPGIQDHINLACSGAVAKNLWFVGEPPHSAGPLPPSQSGGGERQNAGEPTQLERLLQVARQDRQIQLIILSIGGNDLTFADIVADCVFAYAESSAQAPIYCEPANVDFVSSSLDPSTPDSVPYRVEKTIDQIRLVMETPYDEGGAGYARNQYRIVLQSYPSPIPRGTEFAYPESAPLAVTVPLALSVPPFGAAIAATLTNGRLALGCPFWDSDATWARDALVPQFSAALRGVAERKGIGFLDLQDFLQNREICSVHTTMQVFTGTPSASTSEWARSIYVGAQADLFQGDPKEAIHPNAYAQQGLQRCLIGAYDATWNQNDPTARVRCINQPGGPENVTTVVEP